MSTPSPTSDTPAWMRWTGRVISGVVVLGLLASAGMKLAGGEDLTKEFTRLGYDPSVILGIGIAELVCVLLYAIPRTSVLGAALLTGYLGGATATHVRIGDQFISPIIAGVLVWGGLLLRDAALRRLMPVRRIP